MRRTCTFCSTDQYIEDSKIVSAWVFFKCHQCGESATFQGRAGRRLAQLAKTQLAAGVRVNPRPATPPKVTVQVPAAQFLATSTPVSATTFNLPPVPEFLKSEKKVVSEPPKVVAAPSKANEAETEIEKDQLGVGSLISAPQPSLIQAANVELEEPVRSKEFVPPAFLQRMKSSWISAVMVLICFGSATYLIHSVHEMTRSQPAPVLADKVDSSEVSASVSAPSTKAMDSTKDVSALNPTSIQKVIPPIVQRSAVAGNRTVTDVVAQSQAQVQHQLPSQRRVEVIAPSAVLRAGPGKDYRKVGSARSELKFLVEGSYENWFEIKMDRGTAWIRNDLVKQVAQAAPAQSQAQPKEISK